MHRFSDQRMDRARRWPRQAGDRSHHAGLVLPGRLHVPVLTIDRGGLSALTGGVERWLIALSQTCGRQAADGGSNSTFMQNRESFAVQALRFRIARHRAAPTPSGLQAAHRARRPRAGVVGVCASHFIHGRPWTTCGTPRAIGNRQARAIRNPPHVLSGTEIDEFVRRTNGFRRA